MMELLEEVGHLVEIAW